MFTSSISCSSSALVCSEPLAESNQAYEFYVVITHIYREGKDIDNDLAGLGSIARKRLLTLFYQVSYFLMREEGRSHPYALKMLLNSGYAIDS